MKPFVSIIVPTLNEEKYIGGCLLALKNQSYKNCEIIVADSMSKDNTVKIAKKYADKVILTKKRGVSIGRNSGAREAKGDILLFVDADTILLPNTIHELVKPFRNKSVVGSTCPVLPLSSKIRDVLIYWFYNQFAESSTKTKKVQISGTCCAYRKDAFEKTNGFNEEMIALEDFDLSAKISKLGKISFVKKTLALTSHRRIESWGRTKAARKYLSMYLNYLLARKSLDNNEYRPVR